MNADIARQLFDKGAFLVLLGFDRGNEIGIDWNSWTTDSDFKGIKLIPPGTHYVYYSVKNAASSEMAPRSGFFHHFSEKEVLVRRWDEEKGELCAVDPLTNENLQRPENLKSIDANLGPYPYESYKQWCGLSNHITKETIAKLQPKSGRIDSVVNFTPQVDENNRTQIDRDGLPILDRAEADSFGFSLVGRCWWPADCTSAQRTVYAQDSSWILGELIKKSGSTTALFGEFQFAYLAFVIGQVMSAFDHWKQVLRVICHVAHPSTDLLPVLCPVLYFQMKTMPEDFMVDIVSSSNVVLACLNTLFKNVYQTPEIDPNIRTRLNKFRAYCEAKFGWKFYEDGEESEEDDEDLPVVVELN